VHASTARGATGTGGGSSSGHTTSSTSTSTSASSTASTSSSTTSTSTSTSSSSSSGGPCAAQPQAGLAAWYRFEETTGPVCDSSGNGNHGTAQGSGYTRGVAGVIGTAISFNGTDGDVMVPAATSLDMITAGTIELWVRLANTSSVGSTVSRGTGNNDSNVLMNSSCGNMQTIFSTTGVGTTNVTSACNVIPLQTWTHIAVVNDGTTLTMYVNGVLSTTQTGGYLGPLSSALYLGRREQGVFALSGDLDEVKWWTVVRTPAEICADAGGVAAGGGCTGLP